MSKIHLNHRVLIENFLPRTDFHRSSGRPIGKENLWITRGPRAEIEPRQSAARTLLVDPRVAISPLIQTTREISFSRASATRVIPSVLLLSLSLLPVLELVKLTHVNYRDIGNCSFFSNRKLRRIAMYRLPITRIVAVP